MSDASKYSALQTLRAGQRVEIRALRPDDRDALIAAVGRASAQSLYRRFHGARGELSEREVAFFMDVDFADHVALVAVVEADGQPVIAGGARYIVVQPGRAEAAFTVVDHHQGQGIGTALMRHLAKIARGAGIEELIAEVLPENAAMLKVFESSGLPITTRREPGVVHVALQLS
jgi:GNAT superfamily N-acetyltransferase